jgi:hypothetical protein
MIAAVATVRGDTDIAPLSVAHLFAEGVDVVYIATHDEIAHRVLEDSGAILVPRRDHYWHQQRWVNELAAIAGANGADWIVPFDADEFWFGEDGLSVAEALSTVPVEIPVAAATLWQYATWEYRQAEPEREMFKVAYRFDPQVRLGFGGHDLEQPKGLPCIQGVVRLRHLPYRSYSHFKSKVRDACLTLPPEIRTAGYGRHHTCLEHADEAELRNYWEHWLSLGAIRDPIPIESLQMFT